MIGAVQLKLQAMQLDDARNALASAQQAAAQPAAPVPQADVILDLSAAAQALLATRAGR
jgi:hypothetical protein